MSVRSYFQLFFCLFRVPVSLIYHIYSLSTNEAKREKKYGIFRNFCFLKFSIIVVGSWSDCIGSSVYYSGLQKVEYKISNLISIAKSFGGNFPVLKLKQPTKEKVLINVA